MRKIGVVGTNGLPAKYGGWESLVNHLIVKLSSRFDFVVYTSTHNSDSRVKEFNGAKLKYFRLKANGIQSIIYDMISLFHAAIFYDIILVLGTSGCVFLPFVRVFRKTIILNPDGLEWKRDKWNKPTKWFLKLSERFGVKYSDIVVTDNFKIQQYVKSTYNRDSCLIEYGGDHVSYVPMSFETMHKYGLINSDYAFKVCRIEPENNVGLILEAFKDLKFTLVIVGNWNNSKYGVDLRNKYKSFDNLRLLDPIYDQKSLDELRSNCTLYIHGHSAGGTNPSLVEAMNLGLLIVAFAVEYNVETTENKALYFETVNDLQSIVNDYKINNINILQCKSDMKEIATRRYTWDTISDKYSQVFMSAK